MERARFYMDANRPAEALEALAAARAIEPTSAEAHLLAARCLHRLGRNGEALSAADQAVAFAPDAAPPHIERAQIFQAMRDDSDALMDATAAVKLAPVNPDAHIVLSQVLSRLGLHNEALEHAHKAVELAPQAPQAFIALSAVTLRAGRWKESEAASRQALALDPSSAAAMNNLGVALGRRRRPFAGVTALGHAIRANPTSRISQGNANAAIMRLSGWVLSLIVVTAFLAVWYVAPAHGLDRSGLLAFLVVSCALVAVLVALSVRWYTRLPRGVRHSLFDLSSWQQAFNNKATTVPQVVWRISVFEVLFYGIPTAAVLYLAWSILWVMNGSEHAPGQSGSPLGFAIFLVGISIGGRLVRGVTVRSR